MKSRISSVLAIAAIVVGAVVHAACDDDTSSVKEPGTSPSSSTSSGNNGSTTSSSGDPPLDAGKLPDGGEKDCFDNPSTHFQLINACTNADRVDRRPSLKKLHADGGLPPLQ